MYQGICLNRSRQLPTQLSPAALGGAGLIADEPSLRIENAADVKKIPRVCYDNLLGSRKISTLKESTAEAHELGFFVASNPVPFVIEAVIAYRGREQTYIDLLTEPDLVNRIMDVTLANSIERARALVNSGVDALYIGEPACSCSLISPGQFEQFCLPRFRTFCQELHKHNVLIYIHICGNSRPILEMMADTGVDCIEPLDPLGGVEVADAKQRVGHRVSLMGGVNTLSLLNGKPEEIYEEASACCRQGGQNGGYILAAGDMVPDLAPKENVMALVQAAKDFKYAS